MRILGIDPGLGITGYGVIEIDRGNIKVVEAGVIRPKSKLGIEKRLIEIYKNVESLIKDTAPQVIALEELYSHYKHPRTSILMGHARGVICLAAEMGKVQLVNYASTKVKKAVTGRGHASKQQVQRTVARLLNLGEMSGPVDVTDALALALTHANVCAHKL
ncbi:MAG: crossover junction endodeoxyribonuclease RuvC [Candidatus Omnitrophica bacterium]|nr:crossover junction endodeoxyribonuclease RuvC [Candidatus Omnitrophota bacterium]